MIFETVPVGAMGVNCYILASKEGAKAIIIDPGDQERKIRQVLDKHKLEPGLIINTHGHYDHIGADDKFNVPVYAHKLDVPLLKEPLLNLSGLFSLPCRVKSEIIPLGGGEKIVLDDIELKVIHTPGHTRGGITLLLEKPIDKIAFTGDTLFCQGVGRSDLSGGDEKLLFKSIKEKLFNLPAETKIYPGHGASSTIGEEKNNLR
jgi:glyoxylase-like metal-dependent hydrolase (beta-lactamase superfamily II)